MKNLRKPLLPLGGAPGLGGLLGRAPPGLVVAVPGYGLGEAGGEVGVRGLPAELAAELGGVDGVAAVVDGAVAHPVEVVLRAAEGLEDFAQDGQVVGVARVGQLVEHGDVDARVLAHDVVDEAGADEAAAAGDGDATWFESDLSHSAPNQA